MGCCIVQPSAPALLDYTWDGTEPRLNLFIWSEIEAMSLFLAISQPFGSALWACHDRTSDILTSIFKANHSYVIRECHLP